VWTLGGFSSAVLGRGPAVLRQGTHEQLEQELEDFGQQTWQDCAVGVSICRIILAFANMKEYTASAAGEGQEVH